MSRFVQNNILKGIPNIINNKMGFQVIKFQGDSIRTLQTTSDGEFVNCQDLFKALGIKYSSRKVKNTKREW